MHRGSLRAAYALLSISGFFFMTIDEKVGKTLVELGVTDSVRICTLFDEARAAIQEERRLLLSHFTDPQFDEFAKNLHDRWLARKNGLVTRMGERWLNDSPKELKPNVGQEFNKFKSEAKETLALERGKQRRTKALAMWEEGEANERLLAGRQRREKALAMWEEGEAEADLTLPGLRRPLGSIHPVIRVQREIEEIFLGLGFKIETGPEIESVYYNFDALNIPESHPSRDDFDTIYIDSKTLLRTHTSPVQIRAMEKFVRAGAHGGLYIITPGKCYRHDNPDATHTPMFHQVEGLAIDTDITFADLKGTLDYFAKKFFGEKTRTSFNPSFFRSPSRAARWRSVAMCAMASAAGPARTVGGSR